MGTVLQGNHMEARYRSKSRSDELRDRVREVRIAFKQTYIEVEVKMLATQNPILAEAGATIYKISQEEHQRQILEGREDAIRQELGVQRLLEKTRKERDTFAVERDTAIADRDKMAVELDAATARIAELEKQLATKS